ncbi:phosphonate metabolism protein PhnM [Nodularia spumigena CS-584]|jgi:alpha-D-ribose 1-methylphosphonate 5-triphosphate diphosphatase|uniref:Alpha-D-ribose 1-methylphosphonate 5-triphosphate diphosphatase n=3 Tax=Nodularia spumigena TaxID=70799 RepID=A0A2S0PZ14_NODSP|nr:phosphonate metabolism protein PhnM [Nodularia spumigena]AHJ27099.1 Metal-dependent hydrolase involved in phosphonate metabolism [Nodularia spumigena CCY9414]AVZ29676.1 alpha-D-ribose 1-methylphosphonate 5-triphosphate diphosphatase [Nodularia spumigena UHCC 0039]EAW47333.1 phosphonate metabolism protein [Nodularia spumigena CCY9414]MDB9382968.1 phosphonate metabolism protein PhnM [Nodularia spumigena CS-584]MEA5523688.1 phosphonate metabolism protein PhnM [Nodularia spumigena UHCC 0143]
MNEQIYTNYRLQLPDQEILGTLLVRDGIIADIQPGVVNHGQNGQGDYLLPGLIELHTDNLERCMSPRPGIRWPLEAAAVYHDRDLASAGVTTVCDAIAIGDIAASSPRLTNFAPMIDVICQGQATGRFSVEHRIHLRCELAYEEVYQITENYADNSLLSMISLMDHTPGQRQFINLDKFKEYYMGKHGVTATEIENLIITRQQKQQMYGQKNRKALVELAQAQGISLASHDDATVDHVQEAVQNGVVLAEFPTTIEAAKAAHSSGLQVLMGAPNLVLGGSHSGNVSALELVLLDLVDVISSDYVPQSLLQSIFIIAHKTGKPIYEAMRLFTSNPAKSIDLFHNRGSLEIGKRADFITVHDDGIVPCLISTICRGRRVS